MYEFLDYQVRDVMTADVVALAPDESLSRAEALFESRGFNGLPVVGETGELLGLVTQVDVLRAFRFDDRHMFPPYDEIMQTPVREVMSTDVDTVTPRAPLTRVLEKLVRSGRRSLPVIEDGRVVAMIARGDLLRALREASQGGRDAGGDG